MAKKPISLKDRLKERFGNKLLVVRPGEIVQPYLKKYPSGIPSLDAALNGGFPGGAVVQVHGPDGVGKDALLNLVIGENQRVYQEESCVYWTSFGYQADLSHMRLCGCQIELSDAEIEAMGHDPQAVSLEDRGNTMGELLFGSIGLDAEASKAPAEIILEGAIEAISSAQCQIVIINELGSGETKDNVVKALDEDVRMATWASLVDRFLKRYFTSIRRPTIEGDPNLTCVFVVNPARANLDTYSAKFNPTVQTSGYALKHAKSLDIHLRPGAPIKENGEPVGKTINWKIAKGKHGLSEGAEGSYIWRFDSGVDIVADVVTLAAQYDIIKRRGKYYYVDGRDEKIEGGIEGVDQFLRANAEVYNSVKEKSLFAALGGVEETHEDQGSIEDRDIP